MRIAAALLSILMLFAPSAWAQGELSDAQKVKDYYSDWLNSVPGVTKVEVGESKEGKPEIQVHTDPGTPRPAQLPDQLNGIPVTVIDQPVEDNAAAPILPPLVRERR